MAGDGSLVSAVEQWIVDTLAGLSEFETAEVDLFAGLSEWKLGEADAFEQFIATHRRPFALVHWLSSTAMPQQTEDDTDRSSRYVICIVTENVRPAAARIGEESITIDAVVYPLVPGSNLLVEKAIDVLHDKAPNQTGTLALITERTRVESTRQIFGPKDVSVVEIELLVREVPSA